MADSDNAVESRHHNRKKRRLRVKVSALNDTPDRMAPVVGYFSSGYNPCDSIDPPQIRVFRNKKHRSTRLDLVVKPNESSVVEFVGKSYEGEAAVHQPCHYALGILDKDSQTLKVVPIAANKILRLEPRGMKSPEALEEGTEEQKSQDLTLRYRSRKAKNFDKRMKLLIQQTNDPSAREHLQEEMLDADMNNEAFEDTKATVGPNIPPHDLSAKTPEKAYLLDEIILKGEREYLFDILDLHSTIGANTTFWEENYYPSFVANRIYRLKEIKSGEEKEKYAAILSYITHLVNFWKLVEPSHRPIHFIYGEAIHKYKIPRIVYQRFESLFLESASKVMSTSKKELIISYILVLTLFADRFRSKSADIAKDLGMTTAELKPYFMQLGCQLENIGFSNYLWTLPVPIKVEVAKLRRKPRK